MGNMPERRFPPVEEYRGISYIVRDANRFAVAYVYFESEPGRTRCGQPHEQEGSQEASPSCRSCSGSRRGELFYTDLRKRAAQSHHTERFLPHPKAPAGPQIVIAKAQVVVTPILPLTSDLPFIPQSISLFGRLWPVAGLAAAVIVNLAWVGFLGYVVETAFF